jgi:transcription-repair coupling factor (superfamily II helicase)
LYVAAAAHAMPRGAVLFVVPGDRDLEQAVADVTFFVGALEGLSASAAEQAVLPFPSHEVDPYRGMAPHFGVTSARARALHSLASGTARVIVASTAALLPRLSTPKRLLSASIDIKPGQEIAPSDLGELLIDAGFSREDPADEHGEFAIRGGILDIYPAGDAPPVRLEFVGDTIESLRTYDPATQRSSAAIDQLLVVPLRDQLGEDLPATVFDFLARARESRIIVSELDEVLVAAEKFVAQMQRSYDEATGSQSGPEPEEEDWSAFDDLDPLDEGEAPAARRTGGHSPAGRAARKLRAANRASNA